MRRWQPFLVPGLLAGYLVAYVAHVARLPLSATVYPYTVAALIGAGLVAVVTLELRAARPTSTDIAPVANLLRRAGFLLVAVLYPPSMAVLGFALSTLLLCVILLRLFGERRFGRAVVASIVLSLAFFFMVGGLLGIPLPPCSFAELPFGL